MARPEVSALLRRSGMACPGGGIVDAVATRTATFNRQITLQGVIMIRNLAAALAAIVSAGTSSAKQRYFITMGEYMNRVKRISASILATVSLVSAATVTLQQGSNGYSGCADTYIESGAYNAYDDYNGSITNHGSDTVIGLGATGMS